MPDFEDANIRLPSLERRIGEAAERGAHPDHLEVEFGLMISAKGNVIIGGASGEATLRVKLSYDRAAT